jgi:hypothetical protein
MTASPLLNHDNINLNLGKQKTVLIKEIDFKSLTESFVSKKPKTGDKPGESV